MTQDFPLDHPLVISSIDRRYPPVPGLPVSEPEAVTLRKAGFWIRGIAYLIDRVILSAIGLLFFSVGLWALRSGSFVLTGIASAENFVALLVPTYAAMILMEIAYYTYFHGHTGQTVGKMCCGLKVVNLNGEGISYRRAFLRWVGYVLSSLIFYLGFLWVAVDQNRQGWHDKVASTYVIRV